MGEHKGHGDKAPNYPDLGESDQPGSRAGANAGKGQNAGSHGGMQHSGSQQSGRQQDTDKQKGDKQSMGPGSGRQQEGKQQHGTGSQQGTGTGGQNLQQDGQQSRSGTPAQDDLDAERNIRKQGPPGSVKTGP